MISITSTAKHSTEIVELRKELNESVEQFYTHFSNLEYRFLKDEIDWEFLDGIFEYLLYTSKNPQFLKSSEPRSAHFGDGTVQSQANIVAITSDYPPSPHHTTPPPQSDVGDYAHTSVELSHPPTPPTLDICADLACKLVGCHVDSFPQPPSPHSVDPLDCTILCSSVPDSSPIVNEDQVVNGVSVVQPTYAIIHDEYVQESKEELTVKDDSLLATPHPLYPDIPCDSTTTDFPYENSFPDVSTSDHSQDRSDVNLSLHCREDTPSCQNLSNLSSIISENTEGEHPYFSSTPLHDSSNHEDTDEHPRFSDLGCHDPSNSSFDHDVHSLVVNPYKPLFYDHTSFNEVETPQTVEAFQPKLMVMSSPRYLEVGFASDQEIVETRKAHHHSMLCIQDQSNTQISLPPLELHDPMAHALEESYIASTLAQCKWSTFLTFACMSQSRECIHSTSVCSVAQHHGKSTKK